jgi:Transcriptional Coactivator p15 (PC4)
MNTTTLSDSRNRETQKSQTKTAGSALVVIGEQPLNSRDVLRVAFDEYEGRRVIDARKFYKKEDGSLAPTRKGLTLSIDRLPALAELITAALARARADGLLPAAVSR